MAYLRDRNRELRDKVAAFDLKVSNEIDNVKSKEEEIVKLTENFKSTETEQKAKLTHYQVIFFEFINFMIIYNNENNKF